AIWTQQIKEQSTTHQCCGDEQLGCLPAACTRASWLAAQCSQACTGSLAFINSISLSFSHTHTLLMHECTHADPLTQTHTHTHTHRHTHTHTHTHTRTHSHIHSLLFRRALKARHNIASDVVVML